MAKHSDFIIVVLLASFLTVLLVESVIAELVYLDYVLMIAYAYAVIKLKYEARLSVGVAIALVIIIFFAVKLERESYAQELALRAYYFVIIAIVQYLLVDRKKASMVVAS